MEAPMASGVVFNGREVARSCEIENGIHVRRGQAVEMDDEWREWRVVTQAWSSEGARWCKCRGDVGENGLGGEGA